MLMLRKLVSDVCPPSGGACLPSPPDLRIGPTLPPASSIATARHFGDLDDIGRAFDEFRVTHRSSLHSSSVASSASTASAGTLKARRQQHDRVAQHVVAATNRAAAEHGGRGIDCGDYDDAFAGMTFVRCLLALADPTSQLLTAADAERCLAAFIERATTSIAREAEGAVKSFVDLYGGTSQAFADAVESLADPLTCLTDAGLNDVALLHMARMLRLTLVVRRGAPGTACVVFPANPSTRARPAGADPAALICWDDVRDGFAFAASPIACMADVQSALMREDGGALDFRLRALVPFEKQKVATLLYAAACAAIAVGGKPRPTKATYAEALAQLLVGGEPPRTPS
jgi:hypothetical protein